MTLLLLKLIGRGDSAVESKHALIAGFVTTFAFTADAFEFSDLRLSLLVAFRVNRGEPWYLRCLHIFL